ncbi:MAG TPA: hypothetical protein PKL78_01220 [Anaerolineales bacterium]|nr:hypothetical protein [Anaerolineales bacterium]
MIHISITELGLTCALIALVFFVPLFIKRSQAHLKKRIKTLEEELDKKR